MDKKIKMDENGYKYMNQRPPAAPPNVLHQPYQVGAPMYSQGYPHMYGGPPQPGFLPPRGSNLPPGVVWPPISSQPPPEYIQSPVMMQRPPIMNPVCHQLPEGGIPIDQSNYPPGQYYPQGKLPPQQPVPSSASANKQFPNMDFNSNVYKPMPADVNKPATFHPNAPPPNVSSSKPVVDIKKPAAQQEHTGDTTQGNKKTVSIGKSPMNYEPDDEAEDLESENNIEDDEEVVEKEAKDDPSFEPSASEEEEEEDGNESDFSSPSTDGDSDSDEIVISRKRRRIATAGPQTRVTRSQSSDSRTQKSRDNVYRPSGMSRGERSPVRKRTSTRLTTTRRVTNPISDSDESDVSFPSDDDTDYDEMDLCQGQPIVKKRKVVLRKAPAKRPGRKPKGKVAAKQVCGVFFSHSTELERLEAILNDDDDTDLSNIFIWKLNEELLQKYVFVKGSKNFEMTSNFIGYFKNDLTNYVEINVQQVYGESKLVSISNQLVKKDQSVIKRLAGLETASAAPKKRGRKPSANKSVKPPLPKGLRPRGRPKKKVDVQPEAMEIGNQNEIAEIMTPLLPVSTIEENQIMEAVKHKASEGSADINSQSEGIVPTLPNQETIEGSLIVKAEDTSKQKESLVGLQTEMNPKMEENPTPEKLEEAQTEEPPKIEKSSVRTPESERNKDNIITENSSITPSDSEDRSKHNSEARSEAADFSVPQSSVNVQYSENVVTISAQVSGEDLNEKTNVVTTPAQVSGEDLNEKTNVVTTPAQVSGEDLNEKTNVVTTPAQVSGEDLNEKTNVVTTPAQVLGEELIEKTNVVTTPAQVSGEELNEKTNVVTTPAQVSREDLNEKTNVVTTPAQVSGEDLNEKTNVVTTPAQVSGEDLNEKTNVVTTPAQISGEDLNEKTNEVITPAQVSGEDLNEETNVVTIPAQISGEDLNEKTNVVTTPAQDSGKDLNEKTNVVTTPAQVLGEELNEKTTVVTTPAQVSGEDLNEKTNVVTTPAQVSGKDLNEKTNVVTTPAQLSGEELNEKTNVVTTPAQVLGEELNEKTNVVTTPAQVSGEDLNEKTNVVTTPAQVLGQDLNKKTNVVTTPAQVSEEDLNKEANAVTTPAQVLGEELNEKTNVVTTPAQVSGEELNEKTNVVTTPTPISGEDLNEKTNVVTTPAKVSEEDLNKEANAVTTPAPVLVERASLCNTCDLNEKTNVVITPAQVSDEANIVTTPVSGEDAKVSILSDSNEKQNTVTTPTPVCDEDVKVLPMVPENVIMKSSSGAQKTTSEQNKISVGERAMPIIPLISEADYKCYLQNVIGRATTENKEKCQTAENILSLMRNRLKEQLGFSPDIFRDISMLPVMHINDIEDKALMETTGAEQHDKKLMTLNGKTYDVNTLQLLDNEIQERKHFVSSELEEKTILYHNLVHHRFNALEKWWLTLEHQHQKVVIGTENKDETSNVVGGIVNEILTNICADNNFDNWCEKMFSNLLETQSKVFKFLK